MKIWSYRSVKLAMLFCVIVALFETLTSYSLSLLVVTSKDRLVNNLLIVVGIYLLNAVFMYLNSRAKAIAEYFVTLDIKQKLDKEVVGLSYDAYYQKDYGERLSIYSNDVVKVIELILTKYLSMIEKLFVIISIVVALFIIHYSMVILAVISLAVMVLIPGLFQNKLSFHIQSVQAGKEKYLSKIRELLQGFDTFLENSAFSLFLNKSRKSAIDYSKIALEADKFTGLMSATLTFVNSIVTIVALGLISFFVLEGKIEVGMLLVVITLLPSFGTSVMGFLSEREFYKSGIELYNSKFFVADSLANREDIFYKSISPRVDLSTVFYENEQQPIEIEQVNMKDIKVTYSNKQTVTLPKHLEFNKGFKYAIVGSSGSGKSTLLNVLLGKLEQFSGTREINGESYKTLFDSVAYVNQNTFLFNDTIRNNIDLFSQYSDEELNKLLQRLNLDMLTLDMELVDNGKNLSGGQRQRLALARCLLRNKDFIVLDEVTSSLDSMTAQEIESLVFEYANTLVMISHKLSEESLKRIDKIIELR